MSGAGGVVAWADGESESEIANLAMREGSFGCHVPLVFKADLEAANQRATAAEARIVELEAEVARVNTLRHETCLELARKSVAAEAVADRRLGLLRLASYEIRLPSDLRELIQNELTASRGGSGGSAWGCAMCGQKNSSWSTECGRCEAKPPPSG